MQSFQMQARTFPNLTLNDILLTSVIRSRHMTGIKWSPDN